MKIRIEYRIEDANPDENDPSLIMETVADSLATLGYERDDSIKSFGVEADAARFVEYFVSD